MNNRRIKRTAGKWWVLSDLEDMGPFDTKAEANESRIRMDNFDKNEESGSMVKQLKYIHGGDHDKA
jgi:hypothetical protein